MASKPSNTYVPKYVPENLPWYECDGLMMWYDQGKCADFLKDTNKLFVRQKSSTLILYIDSVEVKWFRQIFSNTIKPLTKVVSGYPSTKQTEIRSSTFRTDRKEIFFENETIKNILEK